VNKEYPHYFLSPYMVLGQIYILCAGKRSSFKETALKMVKGIHPPVRYSGLENVPEQGSFLVTLNHYSRKGFSIAWAAAAITAVIPRDPVWMMTGAWTSRKGGFDRARTEATKRIFKRIAEVYGFVTTPPMPPAKHELMDRMLSIRQLIRILENQHDPILCLAPEGRDTPRGKLASPFPGTGKLVLQLNQILKRVLPVGVYEKDGMLHIHFGEVYLLNDTNLNGDFMVSEIIMERIADTLPGNLK